MSGSINLTGAITRLTAWLVVAGSVAVVGCSRVELDDPLNGEFVQATTVTVNGNIYSNFPVQAPIDLAVMELTINGANVPLAPDGTFSTNLVIDQTKVFNAIEADLTDTSIGFVDSDRIVLIYGESIADGDYSPEAIALQINASGLDALEPVVTGLVDFDLPSLLPVGTNVTNTCVVSGPFGTCLGSADIDVDSPAPSISGFDVDFGPQQDSVNSVIALNNFQLNVYIDGSGLVPNCGLRLNANTVTLAGDFSLEPDNANLTKVDVAQVGGISSSFVNFDQTFTSGLCDVPIIGDLIQLIIGDVQPLVRSGLEGFLNSVDGNGNTVIAAAIETALGGVDISGPVGVALNAELDAPFFQVQETTGGVTLGSNARFVTNFGTGPGECVPPEQSPDPTASYHITQPFPSFGANAPGGDAYDVGIGISSSGFNQLLRSLTECGLLVATITEIDLFGTGTPLPLNAGLLSAFFPRLSGFNPADLARIEIAPTIAPLITGAPGPAGELALLQLAQLGLKVIVSNSANSTDQEIADLMLDAEIGIDLAFDAGSGGLVFQFAEPDPSYITVKTVENPLFDDLSSVEALLPNLVGTFLPELAGGLASFPLPSFLGLDLEVVEVAKNGEMLTIYANLEAGTP